MVCWPVNGKARVQVFKLPVTPPSLPPHPAQEGRTALQCATAAGSAACVKLLVDHKADVTLANNVRSSVGMEAPWLLYQMLLFAPPLMPALALLTNAVCTVGCDAAAHGGVHWVEGHGTVLCCGRRGSDLEDSRECPCPRGAPVL